VLPPQHLSRQIQELAAQAAGSIALALGIRGILNVQMIVDGQRVVVIEANPRASRTVPVVAKTTGRDIVSAAVRCALGASLALVGVKAPVDSLWRLPGVETVTGPEMRSTGEVLGLAERYPEARQAALEAAAAHQR
jgi:carbamoyl-phosphate synthase large subunit